MGNPNSFIVHMAQTKLANFLFVMGFVVGICAYSLWKPIGATFNMSAEQSYQIYFSGIAASFMFFGLAYFVVKYDRWRWIPMLVWAVALSRVVFEIWSPENAQTYSAGEYFFFTMTCLIVFGSWLRYRWNKYNKNENNNSQ